MKPISFGRFIFQVNLDRLLGLEAWIVCIKNIRIKKLIFALVKVIILIKIKTRAHFKHWLVCDFLCSWTFQHDGFEELWPI